MKVKIDRNGNGNDKEVLQEIKTAGNGKKLFRVPVPKGFVETTNPQKWRNYVPEFSYGESNLSY